MAQSAYLQMVSEKRGTFLGGATGAGREGSIVVLSFNHEVFSSRDPISGLPSGGRQHRPLVITKEIDRSSPLIAAALVENEVINEWRLDFYRAAGDDEEKAYSIELVNASVIAVRQEMLDNSYAENKPLIEREQVSFVYQQIIWTWHDGALQALDNWSVDRP